MLKYGTLKYVILIALCLFLLPQTVKSQSSTPSSTPSTVQIDLNHLDKAKRAADEALAARDLVARQEAEIDSLKKTIALEEEKTALQQTIIDLKSKQLDQKDVIIANLTEENRVVKERNAKLERSNKRWKKVGMILGGVVAVFVLKPF